MTLQVDSPPGTEGAGNHELLRDLQARCPNIHVRRWIEECVAMCKPDRLVFCDGSDDGAKFSKRYGVPCWIVLPV